MRVPALVVAVSLAVPGLASAEQLLAATEPLSNQEKAQSISAQEKARRHRLTWSAPKDVSIILVTGGGWIFTELNKEGIAPANCRWCSTNALDNGVTGLLGWENRHAAATMSDITAFGAIPLATLGSLAFLSYGDERLDEMPLNALVMVQALTISSALNQTVKFIAGRERPFAAELSPSEKRAVDHAADNNLSFYSGHANMAFALAVSAGTIAWMRDYENQALVWGVGLPIAAFVGYGRIAAKKHYLTDVMLGAAIGSGIGFAVPYFLHRPKALGGGWITLAPSTNGAAIAGTF